MSQAYDIANMIHNWGFARQNLSYFGFCMTVRRGDNDDTFDVNFNQDYFNTADFESFAAGHQCYVVRLKDQIGGKDLFQDDTSKQPKLVKINGFWRIDFSSGWLSCEEALGTFTHLALTVNWAGPVDLAGMTQFRGDIDLGADLYFLTGQWTNFGGPYSRHGGEDVSSWATWDSRKPRITHAQYNADTTTLYDFGVKASASIALRPNPPLDRIRWGTAYTGIQGNHYGMQMMLHQSNPDPVSISEHMMNDFPGMFVYSDVASIVGDSNLATGYSGGPGTLWTRYAFDRIGIDDWFPLGEGGSTAQTWVDRADAVFEWYFNGLQRTGKGIAIVALGTNDIYFGANAAATYGYIMEIVDKAILHGATDVYVCEILDREAADPFTAVKNQTNALINAGVSSGKYKVIKSNDNTHLLDSSNTEYFVDGVHMTASGQREFGVQVTEALIKKENVFPADNQVKIGTAFVVEDAEHTGTYTGADRWTDPGVDNVLVDTPYKIDNVNVVGLLDPDSYFPNQRAFLDNILQVIDAASLTDDEYASISLMGKHYDQDSYNALSAILMQREAVSSTQARLTDYYLARGVQVVEKDRAESNIWIGSPI